MPEVLYKINSIYKSQISQNHLSTKNTKITNDSRPLYIVTKDDPNISCLYVFFVDESPFYLAFN